MLPAADAVHWMELYTIFFSLALRSVIVKAHTTDNKDSGNGSLNKLGFVSQ